MKAFKLNSVSALAAGLLFLSVTSSAHADSYSEQQVMRDNPTPAGISTDAKVRHRSYGEKVGNKLLRGLGNIGGAVIEIPKSIINSTNARGAGGEGSNFVWGLAGGGIQGSLNLIGRVSAGLIDVITFPLPTEAITHPEYPWQQFNTDTSYGPIFQYDGN